jgi:hypothetical protein
LQNAEKESKSSDEVDYSAPTAINNDSDEEPERDEFGMIIEPERDDYGEKIVRQKSIKQQRDEFG